MARMQTGIGTTSTGAAAKIEGIGTASMGAAGALGSSVLTMDGHMARMRTGVTAASDDIQKAINAMFAPPKIDTSEFMAEIWRDFPRDSETFQNVFGEIGEAGTTAFQTITTEVSNAHLELDGFLDTLGDTGRISNFNTAIADLTAELKKNDLSLKDFSDMLAEYRDEYDALGITADTIQELSTQRGQLAHIVDVFFGPGGTLNTLLQFTDPEDGTGISAAIGSIIQGDSLETAEAYYTQQVAAPDFATGGTPGPAVGDPGNTGTFNPIGPDGRPSDSPESRAHKLEIRRRREAAQKDTLWQFVTDNEIQSLIWQPRTENRTILSDMADRFEEIRDISKRRGDAFYGRYPNMTEQHLQQAAQLRDTARQNKGNTRLLSTARQSERNFPDWGIHNQVRQLLNNILDNISTTQETTLSELDYNAILNAARFGADALLQEVHDQGRSIESVTALFGTISTRESEEAHILSILENTLERTEYYFGQNLEHYKLLKDMYFSLKSADHPYLLLYDMSKSESLLAGFADPAILGNLGFFFEQINPDVNPLVTKMTDDRLRAQEDYRNFEQHVLDYLDSLNGQEAPRGPPDYTRVMAFAAGLAVLPLHDTWIRLITEYNTNLSLYNNVISTLSATPTDDELFAGNVAASRLAGLGLTAANVGTLFSQFSHSDAQEQSILNQIAHLGPYQVSPPPAEQPIEIPVSDLPPGLVEVTPGPPPRTGPPQSDAEYWDDFERRRDETLSDRLARHGI